VKKATKSKQQDVYSSRKRQMSKLERRRIDSQDYPARETQRKNPKKTILKGLLPKGGLALCVRLLGSAGALLTLGQGCQVQKLPKMSKKSKNCSSISTIRLGVMG
jgi:hypothetical protein